MNLHLRQRTDRPDKLGKCAIFLDVTWNNGRLLLNTTVKCQPEHFTPTKKLPISTRDLAATLGNDKLTRLSSDVLSLFAKAAAHQEVVTPEQVRACVLHAAGRRRPPAEPAPPALPPTEPDTFGRLYERWKREHPGQGFNARRRYRQVVTRLDGYHPGLTIQDLKKPVFFDYVSVLYEAGLADSTVAQHIKFLRLCFQLVELPVPAWLKLKVRFGRAAALNRADFLALLALTLDTKPYLQREQERALFQTLLLLRDSDLRKLRPHHITEQELPGYGPVLVLQFHQTKTGDEVRLPLPPLAARIWEQWEGQVPPISQQKRNTYLKDVAKAAGLTRPWVRVRFRAGQPTEEMLPLWQAVTTHTLRHTGADLVLLGSGGDQNLKEVALGHLAGASVYGYDTLERYGPLFLQAWAQLLATSEIANNFAGKFRQAMISIAE